MAQRARVGDWELDTIRSRGKAVVVSMTERCSRVHLLAHSPDGTADNVMRAIVRRLGKLRVHVHTLTSDNGKEFACHQIIARALKAEFFFADPHLRHGSAAATKTPTAWRGSMRMHWPVPEACVSRDMRRSSSLSGSLRSGWRSRQRLFWRRIGCEPCTIAETGSMVPGCLADLARRVAAVTPASTTMLEGGS